VISKAQRSPIRALVVLSMLLLTANPAWAAVFVSYYSSDFANGGVVPDNDLGGWQDSRDLSVGNGQWIQSLEVTLNLSSEWSGDLYVALRHQTILGTGYAVLLNRVGTSANDGLGYGDAGFGPDALGSPFRLSDAGEFDVHFYQDHSPTYNAAGQLTGTWKPDGSSFASFQNLDPNGTWTLVVVDMSGGDTSTVLGWGLEITTVPEANPLALAVLTALYAIIRAARPCHRGE